MQELNIDWEQFVKNEKDNTIIPKVDITKGHALMKEPFAPKEWRLTLNILSTLVILAFPISIILFFLVRWWIPVIVIVLSFMTAKAIREEAAKAVIVTSLNDPKFYFHAIRTGTLKIFRKE